MSDINFGQLITTPQQRDAVHVAVAPVTAGEALEPGQHVGFTEDGKVGTSETPIGIVDPYLKQDVNPGEQFWLFLYPKTVTNLRHDWTHPAFGSVDNRNVEESNRWLSEFAAEGELTLNELIEEARTCISDSSYYIGLGTDTPSRWYEQIETFWKHIEVVTGLKVKDKTHAPFSCSC